MSCTIKPVLKAPSMANACLVSLPSTFSTRASSYPNFQQLYSSSSIITKSLSLKKTYRPSPLVAYVAQTDDSTTFVKEEEEEDDEQSSWENEGSDVGESASEEDDEDGSGGEVEGFYQDPSEDAKIFVGNLSYDIDSEKLAQLFDQAGVVEVAEVIYNRETDQSRGFGFVTMSSVEEAETAVEKFNRYELDGRPLTVNKATPRGSKPERAPRSSSPSPRSSSSSSSFGGGQPSNKIYVGNLPWSVDSSRLEQVFSKYGKVVDARVVIDRESGRSRGFGFVTMSREDEQSEAIANLDGQSLDGRSIRANVAEDRASPRF